MDLPRGERLRVDDASRLLDRRPEVEPPGRHRDTLHSRDQPGTRPLSHHAIREQKPHAVLRSCTRE